MKLLIASDLHGSHHFFNLLYNEILYEKPNKIILLGDLLYHGPRNELPPGYCPKELIKLLNNLKSRILCVRGNCDTEVDQMVLEFPIMSDYSYILEDDFTIYLSHGHKYNKDNLPPMNPRDVFISGHTHIPVKEVSDSGNYCLNPGSVSIPKCDSPHSYMIYENRKFIWKDLDGKEFMSLEM